jgi:hypothetical protein
MEFNNDTNHIIRTTKRCNDILCDNIPNKSNSIRTSDIIYDSLQNTTPNLDVIKNDDRNNNDSINTLIGIYRYKFTDEFTNELFKFSKIHQYEHRKDFKEAWEEWLDDNENMINEEVRRLTNLGYEGDILDKMFKSARYYFRKKSTEKKEPAKRRTYMGSQKDLLEAMDEHIKINISAGEFKPSEGFDDFCKKNIDILKEQINMLCQIGLTDSNAIKAKIKKTYKNRYFLIISK